MVCPSRSIKRFVRLGYHLIQRTYSQKQFWKRETNLLVSLEIGITHTQEVDISVAGSTVHVVPHIHGTKTDPDEDVVYTEYNNAASKIDTRAEMKDPDEDVVYTEYNNAASKVNTRAEKVKDPDEDVVYTEYNNAAKDVADGSKGGVH